MESIHGLLAALSLVALTVIVHYESLRAISSITANLGIPHRALSLVVIAGVLLAHLIEICLFAAGFFLMHTRLGLGAIAGDFNGTTLDYFYFSATTYSTLGVGDLSDRRYTTSCRNRSTYRFRPDRMVSLFHLSHNAEVMGPNPITVGAEIEKL